MSNRLEGKVIVVLGASDERSMGAATAKLCVAEGAKVVLAARSLEKVQAVAEQVGGVATVCDITDESQVAALADFAVSTFGRLDGAINFSGINTAAPISMISADDLRSASDVHFVGATIFIKEMAAKMAEGGSIVTTSSQLAMLAGPMYAAYGGSKAGADHVVKVAAVEYGPQNIRVNSLAPGFTPTAMTADVVAIPSVEQAFLNEIPLGRLPTIEDMANAAAWMLSDDCFMTGRIMDISGGETLRRIPTASEMGF